MKYILAFSILLGGPIGVFGVLTLTRTICNAEVTGFFGLEELGVVLA